MIKYVYTKENRFTMKNCYEVKFVYKTRLLLANLLFYICSSLYKDILSHLYSFIYISIYILIYNYVELCLYKE